MASSDLQRVYDELRNLDVVDPKGARAYFLKLVAEDISLANALLDHVERPGEGRLRQLVANAVRGQAALEVLRDRLETWLSKETDEFPKRALRQALESPGKPQVRPKRDAAAAEYEVYSYLAERMKHEVRNGLEGPRAELGKLKSLVAALDSSALKGEIGSSLMSLEEKLQVVGRVLELQDGDQAHFEFREVQLDQWLSQMHEQYSVAFKRVGLQLSGNATVRASDYLLRRIFWNLWMNAHRQLGPSCELRIVISPKARSLVRILISDNGTGFSPDQAEMMFQVSVSKEQHRGRGLLEVYDAVQRLDGKAGAIRDDEGYFRIELLLPEVKR